MVDPDPRLGRTYPGGRTVERLLGRGAMGAVYLARTAAGAAVVLKFLAPELVHDPRLRARFMREADAIRKVPRHPHVVGIEDVVEARDEPFLVMQHIPGPTLLGVIEAQRRLPSDAAARIALDVARGLEAVHAQGLVHRDVKPGNVIVSSDGRATLVDFGVAKDLHRTALTVPGQLLGTAAYLAPELWAGGASDARADVFSLGATLYHALVGAPPFQGADLGELAEQAQTGDFPRPREGYADVPPELERVVLRMLMPEAAWRHPTAAECALDLEGVLAGRPARVPCLVDPDGQRHALLPELRYTLGRETSCDVVFADESVSRRHARVTREPVGLVLCDLRSALGTFVDDVRLEAPRVMRDGDRVRLGRLALRFESAGLPSPS